MYFFAPKGFLFESWAFDIGVLKAPIRNARS